MRPFALCLVLLFLFPAAPAQEADRAQEDAILSRAQDLSRAFAIVAKRIRPSVVNLKVRRAGPGAEGMNDASDLFEEMLRRHFGGRRPQRRPESTVGQGSGVIVDSRGYILTNNHVVGDSESVLVKLADGRELPAEVVGTDPDSDLAVLRITAENLVAAPMGDSDECEVGEIVMAVGSPFGLELTVTSGILSARGRSNLNITEVEDFLQVDAAVNPGNSGGPLVNLKGEIIGINSAIFSKSGGYQGIAFAIPVNIARTVMKGLITNRHVTQSYLGATLQALTPQLARTFSLETPRGALVAEVFPSTPAAAAGLRRGDVVLRYGKREIEDDQQLRNLIATTGAGEEIELGIVRGGKTQTLKVRVEAAPETVTVARRSKKILDGLGIEIGELTEPVRERFGYEENAKGVLVTSVRRGSDALSIGIRPGSLILKVDETEIRTADELRTALGAADGKRGLVLVWRTGRYLQRVRLQFPE